MQSTNGPFGPQGSHVGFTSSMSGTEATSRTGSLSSVSTEEPPRPLPMGSTLSLHPTTDEVQFSVRSMASQGPRGSVTRELGEGLSGTMSDLEVEFEREGSVDDVDEPPDMHVDVHETGGTETERPATRSEKYTVGELLIGVKTSELKENFKAAMKKDDSIKSKPLRFLKKASRVSGLALGMLVNFSARIVSCAVAIATTATVVVGLSIAAIYSQEDSMMWKNPRDALRLSVGIGAGFGGACGAIIGTLGNRLTRLSLDLDAKEGKDNTSLLERLKDDFEESWGHNTGVSAFASYAGLAPALAIPTWWRAAWTKGED